MADFQKTIGKNHGKKMNIFPKDPRKPSEDSHYHDKSVIGPPIFIISQWDWIPRHLGTWWKNGGFSENHWKTMGK